MNTKDLKNKELTKQVTLITGERMNVKQYVSTSRKEDIINFVTNHIFNELLIAYTTMDALFYGSIILTYTDIEIEENFDANSVIRLFDYYDSHDQIGVILKAIPSQELDALKSYLEDSVKDLKELRNSTTVALQSIIEQLLPLTDDAQ